MGTVQELVASIDLPDKSKQRLQKVMQQIGYAADEEVDEVVSALTAQDVQNGAGQAGLDPPLIIRERLALLSKTQPACELVLHVGAGLWVSLRGYWPRPHLWAVCYDSLTCWPVQSGCLMGQSSFWDVAGQQPLLGAVTAASSQRVHICLALVGGSKAS